MAVTIRRIIFFTLLAENILSRPFMGKPVNRNTSVVRKCSAFDEIKSHRAFQVMQVFLLTENKVA